MANEPSNPQPPHRPIRVLHVVDTLGVGGIETWLVQLLERLDRGQIVCDVAVHGTAAPEAFDARIAATGTPILRGGLIPSRPLCYARHLSTLHAQHGPYDIVHAHPHAWCGFILRCAQRAGVPIRIAHSHNAGSRTQASRAPWWRMYQAVMSRWIQRYATLGLACSTPAAASLFGRNWRSDPRWHLLPYGIDLEPFRDLSIDPAAMRADLGLPPTGPVLANIGRFAPQKNQRFLLDVLMEVRRSRPDARLLLVGDGPELAGVQAEARRLKLDAHVIFAGTRDDVPAILRSVVNVVVMPSWWEGFPLALIEAQAAGAGCVFSQHLAPEIDVVSPLIRRVPLEAPAHQWAQAAGAFLEKDPPLSPTNALAQVTDSPVNLERNVSGLLALYRQAVASSPRQTDNDPDIP